MEQKQDLALNHGLNDPTPTPKSVLYPLNFAKTVTFFITFDRLCQKTKIKVLILGPF